VGSLLQGHPAEAGRQLAQLLPPGPLWTLDPGSWLSRVLLAIADELARIDDRCDNLLDEWDPRTALETLEDWERVLGLAPASDATVSARQVAAAAACAARGGSTPAYFVALAAGLGYVATLDEPPVTATHTWRLNVDLAASSATVAETEARAGSARSGDRISDRAVAELEAAINRAKPAHTVVLFAYT
jgi:uncharacterized protein YmfQ (DUF2313 family)